MDQYAMMEERQLREYPFHRKLGAFSVVRENPREAVRSIEYAATLLRKTNRALWIFPQGATLPNDTRPFKLYTGAARIIKRIGVVDVAPVAIRYEFLNDFRPEILVRVGTLKRVEVDATFDVKRLTNCFATTLAETLDELRGDILASEFTDYTKDLTK